MVVTKTNWLGGINQLSDISKLGENEYWILINARVRKNVVEAVNLPLNVSSDLPVGETFQDITAAGGLLIAFVGGKAYYKIKRFSHYNFESVYFPLQASIIPDLISV